MPVDVSSAFFLLNLPFGYLSFFLAKIRYPWPQDGRAIAT